MCHKPNKIRALFSADIRLSDQVLAFLPHGVYSFTLGAQHVLSPARIINTRGNPRPESYDPAKVYPRMVDQTLSMGENLVQGRGIILKG